MPGEEGCSKPLTYGAREYVVDSELVVREAVATDVPESASEVDAVY